MDQEMQSAQLSGSKPQSSTQGYLDIAEIKEGTIVLRDGSLRAVIVVASTNFSLKSGEEQNALIAAYQGFLNGLEFPIEILMQSRKLDIHSYLEKLRSIMQQQTNELLRLQTQEYIEYIAKLIEFASIMNKTFYIVVPFSTQSAKEGIMHKLSAIFNPVGKISLKETEFEKHREELTKRVAQVSGSLGGMGLKVLNLTTEELVELIYNSYNFDTASPIKIKSIENMEIAQNQ